MKRMIALVLAAVMVLLIAACGAKDPTPSTPDPGSNPPAATPDGDSGTEERQPQTITFWYGRSEETGAAIEAAVKAFNEGPGAEMKITVEAIYQGTVADATTKLRAVLQGDQMDQLPDIMELDATGILDFRNTEYAFTVDEALAKDTSYDISPINEAALKNWSFGGTQWGMPFTITTHIMFYNKTILDAAGVTTPPSTFAEIIDAAGKLPAANSNGQKLTAYACLPSSIYLAYWLGQIPGTDAGASYVVNNRNGRDGLATELVCDKEGTLLKFLTGWKEMYESGALLNTGDVLAELFTTEQIAIMTGDTANTVSLLEQIGGRFELGCAMFPRIDENSNQGNQVSGSALCMFNKKDEAKAMAAWELMKYLTSAEPQADIALASGYIPCHSGAFNVPAYQEYTAQYPQLTVGPEQLTLTDPDNVGINVGPSIDFYLEVQAQVSNMLENDASPEDTAAAMSASLNGMLAEYAKANQ